MDVMVSQLHCHHHCILLRSIAIALGRRDEVPVQLPTWLGLGFVTAYITEYCRSILVGLDDSSIVVVCPWGASTSLEEDEAKRPAEQSQLAVAEICDSTSEDVLSDPWWMWWYSSCITIIIAYCWALTLLKEGDTKGQSSTDWLDLLSSF